MRPWIVHGLMSFGILVVSPELELVVESAYREFADYRLTGPLTVCRCPVCVDAQAERELRSVALREMPARLLAEYTHSAHGCDDQAAAELRYFLPRYFELIAQGDPPSNFGIETCLGRLHDARWRTRWPAAEVAVVDAFLTALLRARLALPPPSDPTGFPVFESDQVEEVLCMAAHAGSDLRSLLALCDAEGGGAATLHIANIVGKGTGASHGWKTLSGTVLYNNRWKAVVSPELKSVVENAYREFADYRLTAR